jgi:ATP-dependent Clp protease ATP-binding subunit ClpX
MEEVLLSVMYEVPSNPDAARVLITKAVVLENVNPTIVPRSAPPSRRGRTHEREEKSA